MLSEERGSACSQDECTSRMLEIFLAPSVVGMGFGSLADGALTDMNGCVRHISPTQLQWSGNLHRLSGGKMRSCFCTATKDVPVPTTLGFYGGAVPRLPDSLLIVFPLWLPTLLLLALNWLVWRMTRRRGEGRGFPVEPAGVPKV